MVVYRNLKKLDLSLSSKSTFILFHLLFYQVFVSYFESFNSEYIWKNNISDNNAEDTMSFDIMKKYVFRPDLSNNLTGQEVVTTLHPGNTHNYKINHTEICTLIEHQLY